MMFKKYVIQWEPLDADELADIRELRETRYYPLLRRVIDERISKRMTDLAGVPASEHDAFVARIDELRDLLLQIDGL